MTERLPALRVRRASLLPGNGIRQPWVAPSTESSWHSGSCAPRNRCASQRGRPPVLTGHVVRQSARAGADGAPTSSTRHRQAGRGQIGRPPEINSPHSSPSRPIPSERRYRSSAQVPARRGRSARKSPDIYHSRNAALAQAAFGSAPSGTASYGVTMLKGRIGPVEDAQECRTVRSPNTSKPGGTVSPSATAPAERRPPVTVAFTVAGSAGSLRCINTPLRVSR